ncbi:MAG: GNAT family N-acetyltransferase [Saccharopolyspora sp.]|uniref:GNAT family N-acetyltransferase n=1 Tax=Saccharopolyspora TaxID=1835 RepID=UPI00190DB5AE|nr:MULTISPECIES: GNAT family N-acetyltransferase [unclassified Saccharopolyspora]MBK0869518.1 GNAT family N-acetyltransferase [Saccharopolyspora sp. HNM0986]MBQ6644299.1 GNAT family N-acetyltransferase [Saccharopolyspora sp.]
MFIREATAEDWPLIWPFFHRIVAAAETYTYPPDMSSAEARRAWLSPAPDRATVAVADGGTILGSAHMQPNRHGPGSHVANASYMVDPDHAGRGVGRRLCEESLDWARAAGFRAMQFNAVTETNTGAIRLYESLGFEIIGTVPEAFHDPARGYVGLHVMHLRL